MRWFHSTSHAVALTAVSFLFLIATVAYIMTVLWLNALCRPKMIGEAAELTTVRRQESITITASTTNFECDVDCYCRNFNTTDPVNCQRNNSTSGDSGQNATTEGAEPLYDEPIYPAEQSDENDTTTEELRVKMTTSVEPLRKELGTPKLRELKIPRATQVNLKLHKADADDRDLDQDYKILVCNCAVDHERSCFRLYTGSTNTLAIKVAEDVELNMDGAKGTEMP